MSRTIVITVEVEESDNGESGTVTRVTVDGGEPVELDCRRGDDQTWDVWPYLDDKTLVLVRGHF